MLAGGAILLGACGDTKVVETEVEVPVEVEKVADVLVPVETVLVLNDPWGAVTVQPGDSIKVGLAAAFTGASANHGIDIRNGTDLALEDFPEVKGFAIEILAEDSQCTGDGGTAVASKYAANPQVVGVVGHMCSSSSEPASIIYERAHIPMISPSSTSVAFTARGLEVTNRTCWNDRMQGLAAAVFAINNLGVRKVAIVHDQSSYGEGLVRVFQRAFEDLGGETTAFVGITIGDRDYRAALSAMVAGTPDLLYFGGFQAEGALLVSQKGDVGLDDAIFFGADAIKSQDYIDSAEGRAEGSYSSFADFAEADEDLLNSFLERYDDKFGDPPGPFHAHAYDAAAIMIRSIDTASQLTADGRLLIQRKAINDAIRATQEYQGVSGIISFAENGDGGQGTVGFHIVKNNAWEAA